MQQTERALLDLITEKARIESHLLYEITQKWLDTSIGSPPAEKESKVKAVHERQHASGMVVMKLEEAAMWEDRLRSLSQ
jgi:hypothetical protein